MIKEIPTDSCNDKPLYNKRGIVNIPAPTPITPIDNPLNEPIKKYKIILRIVSFIIIYY